MITINDIINHNVEQAKLKIKCEHDVKGSRRITFEKNHKMIFRKCKLCDKYITCPDPEWIKYHGPSGRG